MAEKNDNWLGSWLTAAKNKSCEVLEFVKKDLEEFGSVVKNEASNVVANTGTALERTLKLDEPESTASNMKRSISSFLGQMNEALNPSPDDSDTEAIMVVEGQDTVKLTKLQQAIYELQKDEHTFTENPVQDLKQQYDSWLEIVEDQLSEERLSKHLLKSTTLKYQYTSLVPLKVEHGLFWKRYLFKKALLEDEIARQEALEKREAKDKEITVDAVQWEEEDFAKDIELTEEEQIKLLEQYENETKQKKNSNVNESENIIFEQPKHQKKKRSKKTTDNTEKNEEDSDKKSDIEIINKDSLNGLPTNSSSNSSTDGEWEKISNNDK